MSVVKEFVTKFTFKPDISGVERMEGKLADNRREMERLQAAAEKAADAYSQAMEEASEQTEQLREKMDEANASAAESEKAYKAVREELINLKQVNRDNAHESKKLQQRAKTLTSGMQRLDKFLWRVVKGSFAAGGGMAYLGSRIFGGAEEAQKFSKAFGMAVDQVYAMDAAGRNFGMAAGEMRSNFQKIGEAINIVRLGKYSELLARFNISISKGNTRRSIEDVTRDLQREMKRRAPSAAVAVQLGAEGGLSRDFSLMLFHGEDVIGMLKRLRREGQIPILSDKQLKNMKEVQKGARAIYNMVSSRVVEAFADVAETLKPLVESMKDWVVENKDLIRSGISTFLITMVKNIRRLVEVITRLAQSPLGKKLLELFENGKALEAIFWSLVALIGGSLLMKFLGLLSVTMKLTTAFGGLGAGSALAGGKLMLTGGAIMALVGWFMLARKEGDSFSDTLVTMAKQAGDTAKTVGKEFMQLGRDMANFFKEAGHTKTGKFIDFLMDVQQDKADIVGGGVNKAADALIREGSEERHQKFLEGNREKMNDAQIERELRKLAPGPLRKKFREKYMRMKEGRKMRKMEKKSFGSFGVMEDPLSSTISIPGSSVGMPTGSSTQNSRVVQNTNHFDIRTSDPREAANQVMQKMEFLGQHAIAGG